MSKKFTKKLQKSISTMVMITTIVWMSGIAMIAPVFVEEAQAAYDKVTLTDITSTSQKIAPNGESVLGVIKLEMTASDIGTGYKTLKYLTGTFVEVSGTFVAGTVTSRDGSDDGLEDIVNSTSSGVQLYQDSGTTAGVFDSEDGRVDIDATGDADLTAITKSTTLTDKSSNYMTTMKTGLIFGTDGEGGPTISTSDSSPSVFYLVLLTQDQGSTTAGAFTATVDGVGYFSSTSTSYDASIAPTSFVTRNITPGTDGVAPTISKVETYDNTPDGVVDRIKVYFSESMSSGVTDTNNFVDTPLGVQSRIEAGADDIELGGSGTWSTTTNLNDTFTIDISNAGTPYTNGANSTGDTWNVIYDKDEATDSDLTDATGTILADKTITTVDMACPYLMTAGTGDNATLHDIDGDGQIDEIRVKFSETLGSASTSAGFTLNNSDTSTDYTLSAINGWATSTTSANTNDIIKIAITESGSSDLNDTYTLAYAEQTSGGIVDVAGNKAVSRSAFEPTLAANPTITKIEVKDAVSVDGKIDTIEITFSCNITEVQDGGAGHLVSEEFSVAGYTISSGSIADAANYPKVYTLVLDTTSSIYDTDVTPDVTYTNDGTSDGEYLHCGSASYPLENVTGDMIIEANKAAPILISATLYESDNDDIWDSGETVQLFFSEGVDPSSIATSWSGDTLGDFADDLSDGQLPDSGLMSVDGKVVTLTASENANTVISGEFIRPETNEVKDINGNSAPAIGASSVTLTVTPTTAPTVDQINTLDENGNGIVDALAINFNGIVDASTITASDFAAARGSNFTIGDLEAATSTSTVAPDLTINEVVTENGGNDSAVIIRFTEVGEDTSAHPQVKYVKGTLADLAGNKVDTFNAYSADNSKFETTITSDTKDKVAPKVMEIRLKDRNDNNKYDQLMVTYSETIKNDAGTIVNGALSSTGWAVADHTIAASGYVYDNVNMALTYATTNAVYKVDINEISGSETAVPEVIYSASGITKDAWNNPLGTVADGDVTEVSEISDVTPPPELSNGAVARVGTAEEVYVIKLVGSNKYKRHIVSPMVFNSYGHLSWSMIQSVSSLDAYSLSAWVRVCTGPNATPAATDKVYEVNADSTMHWLNMTAAQFYARGGSDEAIYNINSGELGLYTLGVDVMYEQECKIMQEIKIFVSYKEQKTEGGII